MSASESSGIPIHWRNFWNLWHVKGEGTRSSVHAGVVMFFSLAKRNADRLRTTISSNGKLNVTTRRDLADHAAELRCAFDVLAIDLGYHIIVLKTGLGRRAVGNNLAKHDTALGGEL